MIDPGNALRTHFEEARGLSDPMASYATLVTLEQGCPRARIVTVKEIEEGGIRITLNRRSPKARQLEEDGRLELHFFWPSLMIQYRVRGKWRIERDSRLALEWAGKSRASRLADHFHESVREQSSGIETHDQLLSEVAELEVRVGEGLQRMPESVARLVIEPDYIEQWIGSPADRLHRRAEFAKRGQLWESRVLVP